MSTENHKFGIIVSTSTVRYYPLVEKQCLDYYKEEEGYAGDFKTLLLDKGLDIFSDIGPCDFDPTGDYIEEIHAINVARIDDCNEEIRDYRYLLDGETSTYSCDQTKFCDLHVPNPNDFNGAVVKEKNTDISFCVVETENFEIGKLSIPSIESIDYDGKSYELKNCENVDSSCELYLDGELL